MNTDLDLSAISLNQGQLRRVQDAKGLCVQCLRGTLWLTQESDPRDVILEAGDTFTIERNGASYLQALSDSSFLLLRRCEPPETVRQLGERSLTVMR